MAGNGRGQMRSYNSNRSQSFIFVGLLVVIAILCFNFWNVSTKNSMLTRELNEVTDKMRQTSMRKISVEKRAEALVQQVRENSEANKKISNEIKLKEDELGQVKNQVTEKENMLSASHAETEEVKQTLETCKENEKTLTAEKEECDKKYGKCEELVVDMEKKKKELLEQQTAERIRILSALATTYGKKLLDIAAAANIVVSDVPTEGLPADSLLNPAPAPVQNVGNGAPLQFAPRNEVPRDAVNLPQQDAGAAFTVPPAGPAANNALLPDNQAIGNVNSFGQNNNLPVQEQNPAPVDTFAQSQNPVPNAADTKFNPVVNAPDQSADKLNTFNNNNLNANNPSNQDAVGLNTGLNAGPLKDTIPLEGNAAKPTESPPLAPQGDPANVGSNDNIQGERPQGKSEFRMEAQQGGPAIMDPKPDSIPAKDQVPLGSNGDASVLQPPINGQLAPQGVQTGEGPQGYDQVRPPQSQDTDKIEVEQHKDVEAKGDYPANEEAGQDENYGNNYEAEMTTTLPPRFDEYEQQRETREPVLGMHESENAQQQNPDGGEAKDPADAVRRVVDLVEKYRNGLREDRNPIDGADNPPDGADNPPEGANNLPQKFEDEIQVV